MPPRTRPARHARAFILLLLAREPACGADLLRRMKQVVPDDRTDTAIIYRSLAKLKKDGMVTVRVDAKVFGPARKIYSLTPAGREALAAHRDEIEGRIRNLMYFLTTYQTYKRKGLLDAPEAEPTERKTDER